MLKKYVKSEEEEKQLGGAEGGRFDEGKVRHDLIPAWAIEKIAEVYTYGAQKYDNDNWLKGMKWSKIQGPLERHYNKWKRGRIKADESNCYHLAMVAWNAIALMCYEKFRVGVDTRCPVVMDMIPEAQRMKMIEHWLECAMNGEEYNGMEVIDVKIEGDCPNDCKTHETCRNRPDFLHKDK